MSIEHKRARLSAWILRFILKNIEPRLTWLIDRLAIRSHGGLHPKNIFGFRHEYFATRLTESDRVLDVACGSGALLKSLEGKVATRMGIDLDPPGECAGVEWVRADVLSFDFSQLKVVSPYSVAVFSHILEHLEAPAQLLRRVGAPRILICVPSEENWRSQLKIAYGVEHRTDPTHIREYTRAGLLSDLKQAGYRAVEIGFNSEGEIVCEAALNA